jgi:hypothetical protein
VELSKTSSNSSDSSDGSLSDFVVRGANVDVVANVVEFVFINIAAATPEHFLPPFKH